jgi:DNA-binding beta-propeller fold protein YncE
MQVVCRLLIIASLLGLTACAPAPRHAETPPSAVPAPGSLPGKKADGSVLLPNQWSLRPAGRQVELGDFPINIAVHPGGRFAAVLHSGFSAHEIVVVDVLSTRIVSRTNVHETFYGIEFSKDGNQLFCSGAGDEVIHRFEFRDGNLSNDRLIKLRDPKQRGIPAGLVVDGKAQHLWTANVWGNRVTRVDLLPEPTASDVVLGTNAATSPAPSGGAPDFDTAAATKRAEAALEESSPADTFPYACRLDEKRQRLYVSLWGQASVAAIDATSGQILARWPTQEHPCEMALTRSGKLLFVANSARNSVTVLDTEAGKAIETICAALYPQSPPGSTPNSLALSPDERTLFIANADNNMVAVFDISTPGKSRSLGFIPVGWYPTSVRVTPDGRHLLVANGKGVSSRANPLGPQPGINSSASPTVQYIARLLSGTLSIIDLPARKEFESQLAVYTAQAYRCTPLKADASVPVARPADSPIPQESRGSRRESAPSASNDAERVEGQNQSRVTPAATNGGKDAVAPGAIRYCLYIVKENRTYDQVFGDMPEGNGDAKLCLFPERVTPNHHQLTRQFVLLDNFYADAEVSADGHEWSMGAYATDFVEKMWPLNYGHDTSNKFPYPSEGFFPIAFPAGGYLWDRARAAAVSYRSYGEFVQNGATPQAPGVSRVSALRGHFDEWYRGFDLAYPDAKRADRFIAELKRFEADGDMPRLQILRLPNDHTHGTTHGWRSPTAYVADNDHALGRIVEAVSQSKFWAQTAIFVVEDDAQNGPDHVDAHRTVALVISPYTKHGAVDSTMYSTSSMLRTIELILGLQPMSQFDAAATPMFNAFQAKADLRPYKALPTNVDLDERNNPMAWGGRLKMDFSREDAVDDLVLNEVIWRSVRGSGSPMPAPVRAAFVRAHPQDED